MNYITSRLHSGMYEKSKLRVHRELKEDFECKKYLHEVSDMDSKLNSDLDLEVDWNPEELGRHSTRNNIKACVFCECESVEHVLWECSEYSSIHKKFMSNLNGIIQNDSY